MIRPAFTAAHITASHGTVYIGRIPLDRQQAAQLLTLFRNERNSADEAIRNRTGTLDEKIAAHGLWVALRNAVFAADNQQHEEAA